MMKTIVTHTNPDLDAICSVWLLKKFGNHFGNSKVEFVPAGTTYKDRPVDANPAIVHVDTGHGRFDHHQSNAYTSAAELVFKSLDVHDEAVERIVAIVVADDHAMDLKRSDAGEDVWQFWYGEILSGFKRLYPNDDRRVLAFGLEMLEAVHKTMQQKVDAEKTLSEGTEFETRWGKAVACATYNDSVLDVGIRKGLALVVRKDPGKHYVRITGRADKKVDLTVAEAELRKKDPDATWYLHPSKVLLRNGSTKNPHMVPTSLSLKEIMEVLQI